MKIPAIKKEGEKLPVFAFCFWQDKKSEREGTDSVRSKWGDAMWVLQPQEKTWRYYEQICVNKFENLEEMVKGLEKCGLPKLSQEEKIPYRWSGICFLNNRVCLSSYQQRHFHNIMLGC